MFVYNGTDYTLYMIAMIAFFLLFAAQYALCRKAKGKAVQFLPLLVPLALVILGYVIFQSHEFLSEFFGILLWGAALFCLLPILLAYLLSRWRNRFDKTE